MGDFFFSFDTLNGREHILSDLSAKSSFSPSSAAMVHYLTLTLVHGPVHYGRLAVCLTPLQPFETYLDMEGSLCSIPDA